MARVKAIPDSEHEAILGRAGRGESGAQIAAWLTEKLGKPVSQQRVSELLERVRKERAPVTQAVIAEKVGKTVGSDLDAVQDAMDDVDGLQARMEKGGDLRGAVNAIRVKGSLLKIRLDLNGGNAGGWTLEQLVPKRKPSNEGEG